MSSCRRGIVAALALGLVVAVAPAAQAAPTVQVIDLGTLADDGTSGSSRATDVSDEDQVVGLSTVEDGRWHAFLWESGTMTDLVPDSRGSAASAVSRRNGWVIGSYTAPDDTWGRFLWHEGTLTDIGSVGGDAIHPTSVNSQGVVGGEADRSDGGLRAILWKRGEVTDLGAAADCPGTSRLGGLNDRGEAAFVCYLPDGGATAHVWRNGRVRDLPVPDGYRGAYVGDINARGDVVGSAEDESFALHAVVWRRGRMVDLGLTDVQIQQFNDRGDLVGVTGFGESARGFLLRGDAGRFDLGPSVGELTGLNDRRQVSYNGGLVTELGLRGYLWQDGETVGLPLPPGVSPEAQSVTGGLTDGGSVAGTAWDSESDIVTEGWRAVLWVTS